MLARLFIALVAIALYAQARFVPGLGLRLRSSTEVYEFSASLNPLFLVAWLAAAAALWVASRAGSPQPVRFRPAGLLRRFVAFNIDFVIHFFLLVVPATGLALATEAAATGSFSWYVERSYPRSTDAATPILILASMVAFLVIYSLPATRGRQTPGSVSLGLFLRTGDRLTLRRSVARSLLGFVTLAAGLFTIPPALARPDRRMWHDLKFNTSVVSPGAA